MCLELGEVGPSSSLAVDCDLEDFSVTVSIRVILCNRRLDDRRNE